MIESAMFSAGAPVAAPGATSGGDGDGGGGSGSAVAAIAAVAGFVGLGVAGIALARHGASVASRPLQLTGAAMLGLAAAGGLGACTMGPNANVDRRGTVMPPTSAGAATLAADRPDLDLPSLGEIAGIREDRHGHRSPVGETALIVEFEDGLPERGVADPAALLAGMDGWDRDGTHVVFGVDGNHYHAVGHRLDSIDGLRIESDRHGNKPDDVWVYRFDRGLDSWVEHTWSADPLLADG